MIDFSKFIVETLSTILPTYYELFLTDQAVPCISYMPLENQVSDRDFHNWMVYSTIRYQIKIWADSVDDILTYSAQIDSALLPHNIVRTNSTDMIYNGRICKILTYECMGRELND